MPELPEVETVRRGLEPVLSGRCVIGLELRRPALRFPFPEGFAARLQGRRIEALSRRAKYLIAGLDSGESLLMHLGMSGRFSVHAPKGFAQRPGLFHHEAGRNDCHDHVVFHLEDGTRIVYNDARRFGFMDLAESARLSENPYLRHLGIEPLGNALSGAAILRLFEGKKTPLKAALLDQRLIAGLGNIYVCEALFRAKLHPQAPAGGLSGTQAEALAESIRAVLQEAVAAGGSTLRDFQHTDGSLGYFQHGFRVYDREGEPCPDCGASVERMVQSGRSSFYCGFCQE